MREYFCAYHSMLDATRKLSDAEVGRLFRGLLHYSATGEQPDNLQGRDEIVFDIFSQQIDREVEKYNAACERNKRNVTSRYQSLPVVTSRNESLQEKEKEKHKDKDNHHHDDDARARVNSVEAYATSNLQHMSAGNMDDLAGFMELLPDELIRFAIDTACANGAPRWAYTSAILQGYVRNEIKTVGDAKAAREKAKKAGGAAKPNQALDYNQREYDAQTYGDGFYMDLEKEFGDADAASGKIAREA